LSLPIASLPGNSNPRRLSHSRIAAITLHFHPSTLLPLKVQETPKTVLARLCR
ncbi:MAG: hypothetical protein ACI87A_001192, partial [Planctomycetota bacterium]